MLGQLAASFPTSVYNQIPVGIFNFAGGGVNAWRNLCGVANAGAAMLKAVTNDGKLIDEYLSWFERQAFPTNAAYVDYMGGGWSIPNTAWRPVDNAPKAVAKGLLCHATHGNWLLAAGGPDGAWVNQKFAGNAAQAGFDRCAKLVYDCVYQMAVLLNQWGAGATFSPVLDPSVATCLTSGCHGGAGGYDQAIINCAPTTAGKMKCDEACHQ